MSSCKVVFLIYWNNNIMIIWHDHLNYFLFQSIEMSRKATKVIWKENLACLLVFHAQNLYPYFFLTSFHNPLIRGEIRDQWPKFWDSKSSSKQTKLKLLDSLLQEVCISSSFDWSLTLSFCLSQSQISLCRTRESSKQTKLKEISTHCLMLKLR